MALGSELYQEAVAKALARRCDARFLKLDSADMWLVQVWERARFRATASFEHRSVTEHHRHLCVESSTEANPTYLLLSHSASCLERKSIRLSSFRSAFKAHLCM